MTETERAGLFKRIDRDLETFDVCVNSLIAAFNTLRDSLIETDEDNKENKSEG